MSPDDVNSEADLFRRVDCYGRNGDGTMLTDGAKRAVRFHNRQDLTAQRPDGIIICYDGMDGWMDGWMDGMGWDGSFRGN